MPSSDLVPGDPLGTAGAEHIGGEEAEIHDAWRRGEKFAAIQGDGLAFLAESSTSPSRARLQKVIAETFPRAQWFNYDAIMEAESIRTALSAGRIRSPQVAAGSPAIFAAIASALKSEVAASSEANGAHARRSNLRRFIVSSPLLSCSRVWAGRQAYNGSRRADVNRNKNGSVSAPAFDIRYAATPPTPAGGGGRATERHFTSEQPPSASGRNAWSAGTVETSL